MGGEMGRIRPTSVFERAGESRMTPPASSISRISESTLSALQLPSVVGAEFPAPLPNGFVRHDDASFGQQILNIPEAQAVSVIQPDGVADDFRRKTMPKVAGSSNVHPGIVPRGELT